MIDIFRLPSPFMKTATVFLKEIRNEYGNVDPINVGMGLYRSDRIGDFNLRYQAML